MKAKVLISFGGVVSGTANQIIDITDKAILDDLVKAGYVSVVKQTTDTPKTTKTKSKKV